MDKYISWWTSVTYSFQHWKCYPCLFESNRIVDPNPKLDSDTERNQWTGWDYFFPSLCLLCKTLGWWDAWFVSLFPPNLNVEYFHMNSFCNIWEDAPFRSKFEGSITQQLYGTIHCNQYILPIFDSRRLPFHSQLLDLMIVLLELLLIDQDMFLGFVVSLCWKLLCTCKRISFSKRKKNSVYYPFETFECLGDLCMKLHSIQTFHVFSYHWHCLQEYH